MTRWTRRRSRSDFPDGVQIGHHGGPDVFGVGSKPIRENRAFDHLRVAIASSAATSIVAWSPTPDHRLIKTSAAPIIAGVKSITVLRANIGAITSRCRRHCPPSAVSTLHSIKPTAHDAAGNPSDSLQHYRARRGGWRSAREPAVRARRAIRPQRSVVRNVPLPAFKWVALQGANKGYQLQRNRLRLRRGRTIRAVCERPVTVLQCFEHSDDPLCHPTTRVKRLPRTRRLGRGDQAWRRRYCISTPWPQPGQPGAYDGDRAHPLLATLKFRKFGNDR
jgi:hypothetical protein